MLSSIQGYIAFTMYRLPYSSVQYVPKGCQKYVKKRENPNILSADYQDVRAKLQMVGYSVISRVLQYVCPLREIINRGTSLAPAPLFSRHLDA